MSLFRQTTQTLTPHARLSLTSIGPRAARPPGASFAGPSKSCVTSRRGLHIGALAGEAIQSTASALSWVHASGVPWYLTIPLLAVGVNITFRFPLQLYVAKLRERRAETDPLIVAWARRHSGMIPKEQKDVPERVVRLRVAGAIERSRRRIYKNWGVQRWKSMAPLLSIFPFITISEALRQKCGAPLGWISQSVGLGSQQSAGSSLGSASSMFDPSLIDGGYLWFMDLTSADPFYGLPIICSGILVWNTWAKMSKDHIAALLSLDSNKSQVVTLTRLQKLLGRVMLLVPILPLLFADLPSAIFLYWASSFGLSSINEAILNRMVTKKSSKFTETRRRRHSLPFLGNPIKAAEK
ncbi:mitochondrial export translocase Oxa2 [Dactylonectria macrodidyma]|uniref:Mitochondrial export translocase Oxa2 n=1 Tax=Dactylonectria macrodidyma TaxID=307937 RepID=A0A9P9EXR0_9HYPO|nr:mitochondrial export translocase Oxa2 [Dactylonectria macrodidyma]